MGKFGWDLPLGCSHADIERHFGGGDPSPESEKVLELLDGCDVPQEIIDNVCMLVDDLVYRAENCNACAKRQDDAEAILDAELEKRGEEYWRKLE